MKEQKAKTEDAVQLIREEMSCKLQEMKVDLCGKEAQVASLRGHVAKLQQQLGEIQKTASDTKKNDDLAVQKAQTDTANVTAQNESLVQKIKILEEKNKGLEEALSGKGGNSLNSAFAKELETAKAEIEKRQKTLAGLDMYMRDVTEKKDLELKQYQQTIADLKRSFEKERKEWQGQDAIKRGHIERLKSLVDKHNETPDEEEDTFEEILREEMRVMKAAFELKMSNLREESTQKSIACSREVRLLKEELESERRQSSAYQAKIKALEDSKKK